MLFTASNKGKQNEGIPNCPIMSTHAPASYRERAELYESPVLSGLISDVRGGSPRWASACQRSLCTCVALLWPCPPGTWGSHPGPLTLGHHESLCRRSVAVEVEEGRERGEDGREEREKEEKMEEGREKEKMEEEEEK